MDLQKSSPHPYHRSPMPENIAHGAVAPHSSHSMPLDRVQIIETWTNADVNGTRDAVIPQTRSESLSRAVNIVLAAVGMVLAAPLFLIVGIAVKLTSSGPIFYRQTRVGIDRRRRGRGSDML